MDSSTQWRDLIFFVCIYRRTAYNRTVKPKELVAWREKYGYSQVKLAKTLGVDVMTVSRWERAVYEIPPYLHLALKCLIREKGRS